MSKVFDGFNVSPAELEVALKVLEGLPSNLIAAQLGIKPKTVKFHLGSLYRKTNVKNRAEFLVKFKERSTLIQFDRSMDVIERRLSDCIYRESMLQTQILILTSTRRSRAQLVRVCSELIQNETNLTNKILLKNFVDSLVLRLFSNK